jgi:hypothetical protein
MWGTSNHKSPTSPFLRTRLPQFKQCRSQIHQALARWRPLNSSKNVKNSRLLSRSPATYSPPGSLVLPENAAVHRGQLLASSSLACTSRSQPFSGRLKGGGRDHGRRAPGTRPRQDRRGRPAPAPFPLPRPAPGRLGLGCRPDGHWLLFMARRNQLVGGHRVGHEEDDYEGISPRCGMGRHGCLGGSGSTIVPCPDTRTWRAWSTGGNAMLLHQLNNSSRLAGDFSTASSGACTNTQRHRDKLVVATLANHIRPPC